MSSEFEKVLLSLLEKMDTRLTRIEERQAESNQVQVRHEENLKTHMNRSAAAEEAIKLLRSEIKPVKAHVLRVQTVLKALAWVGALAVGIATIYGAVR